MACIPCKPTILFLDMCPRNSQQAVALKPVQFPVWFLCVRACVYACMCLFASLFCSLWGFPTLTPEKGKKRSRCWVQRGKSLCDSPHFLFSLKRLVAQYMLRVMCQVLTGISLSKEKCQMESSWKTSGWGTWRVHIIPALPPCGKWWGRQRHHWSTLDLARLHLKIMLIGTLTLIM